MKRTRRERRRPHPPAWTAVAALSLLGFLGARAAPIDYTFSDPWGNLLTAQAILEHGTVRLDAYADAPPIADLHLAWKHRGHLYYYFPLGTPLLTVPAVAAARRAGLDMAVKEDNTALQRWLAALVVAAAVPLVFVLCRLYLPPLLSLLATVALVFGSSTVSTLGTALWSADATFLLGVAVCILLVRDLQGKAPLNGPLLGALLFAAYLCRPTAAVLAAVVMADLGRRRRWRALGGATAVFAALFASFVTFSLGEFGQAVPAYYNPSRLGSEHLGAALAGLWLSPSRGILVLSPYLLLILIGALALRRRAWRQALFPVAAAWLSLHWLSASSYPNWWGGWCYGNRLFADAWPAVMVLTLGVARAALEALPARSLRAAVAAFAALTAVAAGIHSWKGLYDPHTFLWCRDGTYVDYLFDWRHPQFLASAASLDDHRRNHLVPKLPLRRLGDEVTPASRDVVFAGWSRLERDGAWRWSDGGEAAVLFRIAPAALDTATLEVVAGTYHRQRVPVSVNGETVGEIVSSTHFEPARYTFPVPRSVLAAGRRTAGALVVEIGFAIPGARRPSDHDPANRDDSRRLGLCLRRLRLAPLYTTTTPAAGGSR